MGVPTFYARLLSEPGFDAAICSHVRLCVSGSAPLLEPAFEEFRRRTGHTILERYGMTEALMITSNPYDGPRVAGSVGPALPGISVRVVGEDGLPSPNGQPGVLHVPRNAMGKVMKAELRVAYKCAFAADPAAAGDVAIYNLSTRTGR